jgi:hypothetical protein
MLEKTEEATIQRDRQQRLRKYIKNATQKTKVTCITVLQFIPAPISNKVAIVISNRKYKSCYVMQRRNYRPNTDIKQLEGRLFTVFVFCNKIVYLKLGIIKHMYKSNQSFV